MTPTAKLTPATRAIRNQMTLGLATVAILVVGFGGWAANANLASAVVGMGTVAVEGNIKRVQHRDGGIVGAILVKDGDVVQANDLLVQLDDTLTRANLQIVSKQLNQLTARSMRLTAERDGADHLTLAEEFAGSNSDPAVTTLIAAETSLFKARRTAIEGQKSQLSQRISQVRQEIGGLGARRDGKNDELSLIDEELTGVESLYKKGLTSMARYAELRRMKAQLSGELGQLVAELARAEARITEAELQIIQLDEDRRAEVMTELGDIDGKLASLSEQRIAAIDQLDRIDIRAPQTGIVHQLQAHTIGGVVAPGETILQIVPTSSHLLVETRLKATDIDQVHVGQHATMRFSAFNQRTTPEIGGSVSVVGADLTHNEQTGEAWYTARIAISEEERAKLGKVLLVPGMPVEAFIQTGERTASSYLLKPFWDQLARSFKEE